MKCGPACLRLLVTVLLPVLPAYAGLDRDIVAGSEDFTVFSSRPTPPPDAVRYVDASNTGPADGSKAHPWRRIQDAVSRLQPGQLAYVAGGLYEENLTWATASDGTKDAPILLQARPGDRPLLRNVGTRPLMDVTRSHWIIDGFDLDGAGVRSPLVRFTGESTHHVLLRRSTLSGGGGGTALFIAEGAHHIQVDRTTLSGTFNWSDLREDTTCQTTADCAAYEPDPAVGLVCASGGHCATREDGHGVSIYPDSHHVLLTSNVFQNNSGDGVQCVGPAYVEPPGTGTRRPHDVLMVRNTFANSARFDGNTENAVDIKDCDRVTLRGGRMHHFRPTRNARGNSSQGEAILIHFDAQGVLIDGVDVSDACRVMGLGRTGATEQLANVVIRRNVFHDPTPRGTRCTSDGVRMTKVKGVDLYHNTFDGFEGGAVSVGEDITTPDVVDVDIWNNLFKGDQGYYLGANRAGVIGLESGYNLFANNTGKLLRCNFDPVDLEGWSACPGFPPLDAGGTSRVGDPLFSSTARDTEPGSPARDMALDDGAGEPACEGGPDVGAKESCTGGPQSPAAPPPAPVWGVQEGTPEDDLVSALAVGNTGALFFTGATRGAFSYTPQGGWDAIVGRRSPDGRLAWSRALGGPGDELAWALALDARSQVFVAGTTGSALWGPLVGESDGFVAKYSPDGVRQWVRQLGSEGMDAFFGVATDGAAVYAAGTTTGGFPGQPHHPSSGGDALLVKLDANGNTEWIRVWGLQKDEVLKAVTFSRGSVYVLGEVSNQFLFVARFTPDGTRVWQRQYSLNRAQGTALATDAEGNVYALGAFVPASQRFTPWLLKLDASGREAWTRTTFAEPGVAFGGLACDARGDVLIAGRNSRNRGLWKVSPEGTLRWVALHPSDTDLTTLSRGLAVDAQGNAYLGGETGSDLFAPLRGGVDAWWTKYPATTP
ncbi:right-handed parallel beta-helix repeat-containing protein [Corallococcus sp. RDP092CA]|uniref:right-handed parallel beta-helix repeat-containing protein n=1 Tax=Corallococcus sp. RDP092CA TaxID=3109369 RepID=UPI0035AFF12F